MNNKKLFLFATTIAIVTSFSFTKYINETSLKPFEVEFISGCNSITHSKIKVYQKKSEYYADHLSPTYFDGEKIDSLWTIKLTDEQIKACNQFINKAKSLPRKCNRFSSVENHHIITIGRDTMDIDGDCNWDNLDFHFLDTKLFDKYHTAFENRQKTFIKTLQSKLLGKWFLESEKPNLTKEDIVTFSKNKETNFCWEFSGSNIVKSNNSGISKVKDLKKYKLEISNGWNETVFEFRYGKTDYLVFTFVSVNDSELKLKYLW